MPSRQLAVRSAPLAPGRDGLDDPVFERDSCGVGFVARLDGRKSHSIVQLGLQVLRDLQHRGACGCDQDTGDGASVLLQMPDAFFRAQADRLSIPLPAAGDYGVAFVFLPRGGVQRLICQRTIEAIVVGEGQTVLGWRNIPVVSASIGWLARSQETAMEQLLIGRGAATPPGESFERSLYVIRRKAERWANSESLPAADAMWLSIASCSARTIVYKGMLKADQLSEYFPDLSDPTLESALALVHSRYSTNMSPQWGLAQPFHLLAHNGEINTLQGNVHWLEARQPEMRSTALGPDLSKVLPLESHGQSDSAILDQVLELLDQADRSLPHAVMILAPEAYEGQRQLDPARRASYQYHSCLTEPWDGPTSLVFTDGRLIGATLDCNGLRPSQYVVTRDDLVVMASKVGVLSIPAEEIRLTGHLRPGKMFLVDTGLGQIIDDGELKGSICRRRHYPLWIEWHHLGLHDLPEPSRLPGPDLSSLMARPQAFGYTQEDIQHILIPMAKDGKEPVSSMGTDIPLAVLSTLSQLLYNYFEAIGLGRDLIDRYFTGTPSRIEGVGLDVIARESLLRHEAGLSSIPGPEEPELDHGGEQIWRRRGESHMGNPETIQELQHALKKKEFACYREFARAANGESRNLCTPRGLLKIRKGRKPILLELVEPAEEIVKLSFTGAMSFGSIGKEAHEALAIALNRIGGRGNTGEGGEDPARFKRDANGDWRNRAVKKVASGRFGVTANYLANAVELQIKMAQGVYTGSKVGEEIVNDFSSALGRSIKVFPRDYRRVLEQTRFVQRQWELVNG